MSTGKIIKTYITETAHIVREASTIRCKNSIHGHSYKWIVTIEGTIHKNGMIIDFKDLEPIKKLIDLFDHAAVLWEQEQPDIIEFFKKNFARVIIMNKNCTAENMARAIFKISSEWLSSYYSDCSIVQVDVWETKSGCSVATESSLDDSFISTHDIEE